MCKENCFDPSSGLSIDTWCGELDDDLIVEICQIDDSHRPRHYVQIRNRKTFDQQVTVKGTLTKTRAKFEGDSTIIANESQWEQVITVRGKSGVDTEIVSEAVVSKKVAGNDSIRLEVRYQDHWNPAIMRRADSDQLVFGIQIV